MKTSKAILNIKNRITISKTRYWQLTALKSKYFLNLLLSLVLVSVLILSMVTIAIYNQFLKEYKAKTIDDAEAGIRSVESMFTQKLLDMKTMTYVIYRNPAFTYYPYPQEADEGTDLNIVRQLQNYTYSNPFFADIAFYRLSEPNTVYLSHGVYNLKEMQTYVFDIPSISSKEDYSTSRLYKGISRLQETYDFEVYAFCEPLSMGNLPTGKTIQLFVYKQTLDAMIEPLFNDKAYGLYILNENNQILYSNGPEQTLSDVVTTLDFETISSHATKDVNSHTYHLFSAQSTYNNWRYVVTMENDELFTVYHHKLTSFSMVILIAAFVVIALSALFAIFNYSPIRKLFGKVALNFSDTSMENIQRDELQYIGRVVDSIIESRSLSRQRAVLSNLLWGQFNDEESALNETDEAAIQFAYNRFVVAVIARSPGHHEDNLHRLEALFKPYKMVTYCAYLLNTDFDAVIINYDDAEFTVQHIADCIKKQYTSLADDCGIGLGESVSSVLNLEKSFLQAKNAYTCLSNGVKVQCYADCLQSLQHLEMSGYKKEISSAIRRGETEEALDCLTDLLGMVYDHTIPHERFKFIYYNLLSSITETMNAMEISPPEEFTAIVEELMSDTKLSRQKVGEWLERLIVIICKLVNENQDKEEDNALLEKINQVINEHLCDPLMSLEMLAEQCQVSTSYLGRYFKNKTGSTPMRYVDIQKMEYAKKLLRETDDSLNEIVSKSGYIDASNFIRKFKKETGITPINYRKNYSILEQPDENL